jgi:hypothetical protein
VGTALFTVDETGEAVDSAVPTLRLLDVIEIALLN